MGLVPQVRWLEMAVDGPNGGTLVTGVHNVAAMHEHQPLERFLIVLQSDDFLLPLGNLFGGWKVIRSKSHCSVSGVFLGQDLWFQNGL